MNESKKNVFVSDCGFFVAIRVPNPVGPLFDVWRHDGSEMWIGERYVKVPGCDGYNLQRLYTEPDAKNTKIVGAWANLGHEKRDGTWIEGFELSFVDLKTKERHTAIFHTAIGSLAPLYKSRRLKKARNKK